MAFYYGDRASQPARMWPALPRSQLSFYENRYNPMMVWPAEVLVADYWTIAVSGLACLGLTVQSEGKADSSDFLSRFEMNSGSM